MEELLVDARACCDARFVDSLKTKEGTRVAMMTALLWVQLLTAWGVALLAPLPFAVASFVVICACVQGMLNWVHEASHFSLFRSRKVNDLWTNLFFASPIGMNIATYRRAHMSHHAYLSTPKDMDHKAFDIDIRGQRLYAVILRVLVGYDGLKLVLTKYAKGFVAGGSDGGRSEGRYALFMTIAWNTLLLALCIAAGRWYLYGFLWVFPIICVSVMLNVVRSIAEHQPMGYPGDQLPGDRRMTPLTRTTLPGPVEKWLIYQANFNYHLEHHLFPLVPAHNLPRLHARLRERGFYKRHPDCLQTSGVARVLSLSREGAAEAVPVSA